MYACASIFGLSEWSLRLPALGGAALYFAAVYRIARHAFGAGRTFLLAIALLTLHPLILDFLVVARGYGMALALWMWSLAVLLPCFEQPETAPPRRIMEAAVALSLSVVANLVLLIPAAVLAVIALWRLPRKIAFATPIAAVALLFAIVSPLRAARPDNFYAGSATITDSLRRLAWATVEHSRAWRDKPLADAARDALAFFIGPAILIAGLAGRRSLLVTLSAAIAVASALLLWLLHLAFRVPYPEDRTGLYFLPLTLLTLVGLANASSRAAYALALLLLLVFAAQWNVRKFLIWEYDADTREIGARIAAAVSDKRPNSVRVACSWGLEPALNFYREKNRWTWMAPVTREPLAAGANYYAIISIDRQAIESLKLKPIYEGAASGTILAISNSPSAKSSRPGPAESTRPSARARIELGLLVRGQDLIKRRVRLRVDRRLLRLEAPDRGRDLIDRGRAVTLHRVAEALARRSQALAHGGGGGGGVGENRGGLLLLGCREAEPIGQKVDPPLGDLGGRRRSARTLGQYKRGGECGT
jgi:hypothetical protein